MKICSVCQYCYEDAVTTCPQENHGNLTAARVGTRKIAGKYRLDVLLERNAAGDIYQASGIGLDKSFVIRLIPLNLFGHAQQLRERLSNVQAAASINHSNVTKVCDYGLSDNNEFCIVTEKVDGQTLREHLLSADSLSEATAIMIARQAAEGLEAAHAAGVIHRGINTANIVLTPGDDDRPLIKLQNFDYGGISQQIVTTNISAAAPYLDILRYLSPEQCTRQTVDARTDIYSLGMVLYEMLSGQLPFDAPTPTEIVDKQINEQPSPLNQLRFDVKALLTHTLMRSLNKNPASRSQTAASFARHLRHLEYITKQSPAISQKTAANSSPAINFATDSVNTFESAPAPEIADNLYVEESQLSGTPTHIAKTFAPINADNVPLYEENFEESSLLEVDAFFSEPIRVQKKIGVVKLSSEPILVGKKGVRIAAFASQPILVKRRNDKNISPTMRPIVLLSAANVQEAKTQSLIPIAADQLNVNETRQRRSLSKRPLLVGLGLTAVLAVSSIFGAVLFNRQIQRPQTEQSTAATVPQAPVFISEEEPIATDNTLNMAADSNPSEAQVVSNLGAEQPSINAELDNKSQPREETLTNNTKTKQLVLSGEKSGVEKPSLATVAKTSQTQPRETIRNGDSEAELTATLDKLITATNARNVDEQMGYYAPQISAYYLARNASLKTVRAEKNRVFANADVDIQAGKPEIVVSNNGQTAKMRFRKKYAIKKGQQNRSGEVIQELQWVKSGKDWKIISERDVKVTNR